MNQKTHSDYYATEPGHPSDGQSDTRRDSIKTSDEHEKAGQVRQTEEQQEKGGYEDTVEPTRYGDWEIGGRCIDF